MGSTPQTSQFWRHSGVLAAVGVVFAVALGAAFMSIGHSPQPRDVPVAVVGPPAAAQQLEAQAPGKLSTRSVPDLAAAQRAIDQRDVYGAVVPGEEGVRELLIAPAASNQVANFLRGSLGQPTPDNVPKVVNAKPLPHDDSNGLSISLLIQTLIMGATIGVLGIKRLLPRFEADPRRGIAPMLSLGGYALLFGVALAAISGAFGVGTDAALLDRALALSLISVAVIASTAALVALMGPIGSAVSGVLFFVLGAQISGGGTAPEFLSPFWSDLGQALPGGAGVTLLRDVFYFPEASTGGPIAILAAYAGAGLLMLVALNLLRARRRSRAGDPVGAGGDTVAIARATA
jgi:hypothetical protein